MKRGTGLGWVRSCVVNRLASWKGKLLSLAGRATLIKAVTASIPVYSMQTVKLPASVCEDLDKLNRNFFWGASEKKRKIHLCQWDLACIPKSRGGMGFKKTTHMNQSLLAKIGWRIQNKDEGLWAKIYEAKYLKGRSIMDPTVVPKPESSSSWKGILYGADLLAKGMTWRIGKGDQVKFWKDKWITDEALIHYTGDSQVTELHCPVSSFFKEGWWDIVKLRSVLGEEIVQKIINTPVDFIGNTPDIQIWKPTANGIFSVKSAYNLLFHPSEWPDDSWKFIWGLKIPPKMQFFVWLMSRNKILSNEQRARRRLTTDPSCSICGWHNESPLHMLRDCTKAKSVWNLILNRNQALHFFQMDFQPWLRINLTTNSKWQDETPWNVAFAYTCWYIWKWRNIRVFGKEEDLPFDSRAVILKATQEWSTASSANTKTTSNYQITLAWEPPPPGYLKLNVDGSYKCASGSIGAGGVIRDELGNWTGGFAINLGKCQILEAEIWGLFFGLKLAVQKEINNLIVEMDSATAVLLFQNSNILGLHPLATLLTSCWELINQIDNCVVKHVYREKNMVADCLAKGSFNFDLGFVYFADIPRWIGTHLEEDLMGVHRTRIIAVV